MSDIHAPMFVVATVRDHVAPWKSVYKIHYQVDADVTFLLTSGGDNAGIVAPPSEARHSYQVCTKEADSPYIGSDEWQMATPLVQGSWWPEWTAWLVARSSQPCDLPAMGCPRGDGPNLPDAPGDYVRGRGSRAASGSTLPWHRGNVCSDVPPASTIIQSIAPRSYPS